MKFFKTLRGKLTTFFFISTSIIVFITILLLVLTTRNLIENQVNHHLHIVVNEARRIVEENHSLDNEVALKNLVSAQGMTIILLSSDGTPILQTNSYDVADVSQHEMQRIIFSSTNVDEPKHFRVNEIYFATVPVDISGIGPGTLAVGFSTELINETFQKVILTVSASLLVTLLIVSLLWHRLINKYLSPLEEISYQSHRIKTSNDLNENIKVETSIVEFKNISNAFNSLLKKLKKVFNEEHVFFSDTAHSLKTPLAVIRSYIETLPRQPQGQKKEILRNIDLLNNTIQDLLLISKLQNDSGGARQKVNLSQIVHKIAELTQTIGLEKNIQVKSNIQSDIYLKADESLLNRAISNIAKNAVDHEKKYGQIAFNLKEDSNGITLKITDTGSGMSASDLKKIFTRFYRGKNSKSKNSSGLGLAISKAVVENFNGKINISSKLRKGTQVFIFFS